MNTGESKMRCEMSAPVCRSRAMSPDAAIVRPTVAARRRRADERLAGRVAPVDRRASDAGSGGDRGDRQAAGPVLHEQLRRDAKDARLGLADALAGHGLVGLASVAGSLGRSRRFVWRSCSGTSSVAIRLRNKY